MALVRHSISENRESADIALTFGRSEETADAKTGGGYSTRPARLVVEAGGLEPPNLLTASQALYQLSYAPVDREYPSSGSGRT
jgi:hypothetical protein